VILFLLLARICDNCPPALGVAKHDPRPPRAQGGHSAAGQTINVPNL